MRRSEFRKPETAWWARESAFTSMAPNPRARAREGRGCCRRRHFFLLNSFERNPVRGEDGEVGRSGRTRGARRASDVGQPSDPRSERPAIGPTCSSRLGGAAAAGRTMVRSTAAPSRNLVGGAPLTTLAPIPRACACAKLFKGGDVADSTQRDPLAPPAPRPRARAREDSARAG